MLISIEFEAPVALLDVAPTAATVMSYVMDGWSPEMEHAGLGQETVTGVPPLRGAAVMTNSAKGPPELGAVAATLALDGPVGVALSRVGAPAPGRVNRIVPPRGVEVPDGEMPTTVAEYLHGHLRPLIQYFDTVRVRCSSHTLTARQGSDSLPRCLDWC